MMKTPITYYGGKQKLAPIINTVIPRHTLYAEPFCGGAAVFFSKRPSEVEVLNDLNGELINFYIVVREQFTALQHQIMLTLHSRKQHRHAWIIYNYPELFDPVKRAWAVWTLSNLSFAAMLDGSFGYDKTDNTTTKKLLSNIDEFTDALCRRLERAQIECADALYIIKSRDYEGALFYCDPPYFNSDMGHYRGYTRQDFKQLLDTLGAIKGKFLLSSYPSEMLEKYRSKFGWEQRRFEQHVSVNNKAGNPKVKTEVLTANYPICSELNQLYLF